MRYNLPFIDHYRKYPIQLTIEEELEQFKKIKQLDNRAIDNIFNHNVYVVFNVVKRFFPSILSLVNSKRNISKNAYSYEDIEDVIMLLTKRLYDIIIKFNPDKKIRFHTFAYIVLWRYSNSLFKKINKENKRKAILTDIVYNSQVEELDMMSFESYKTLSVLEKQVIKMYIYGLSQKEIRTKFKLSYNNMKKINLSIKHKLTQ